MSLIETAKLNGIEPFAWLRDVLTRMVDGHPAARISGLISGNCVEKVRVRCSLRISYIIDNKKSL
ncbi:transposase domain-containing protein [Gluconobacter japonicus]|uniref:transposase domain-containing protein n=1 Tax=Gluconobacter japonicus TaxID=376620 RepID=UPI001F3293AC